MFDRTTWLQFQTLIDQLADEYDGWKASDLFFYQYASVVSGVSRLGTRGSPWVQVQREAGAS